MGAILKLKLTTIGNSVALILPGEVLTDLNVGKNDEILLTAAPDGYRLMRYSSDFEEQVAVARKIMNERREALRELAK
jgi:putative addiction module antidote